MRRKVGVAVGPPSPSKTRAGYSEGAGNIQSDASRASARGWAVAALVFGQLVFFIPNETLLPEKVAFLLIVGALGLPFLLATALGFSGAGDNADSKWAARFALAFLVWAAISASFAAGTLSSYFGGYASQTGWFFFLFLAGAWAISTRLSPRDGNLLELAIIGGATCNGAFSFIELHINTNTIGLPRYLGTLPIGTLGNPVYVGALLAASLALVIPRFARSPLMWSPVVLLIGLGLGACAERLPVILTALLLASALFLVGYQARRSSQKGISSTLRFVWPTLLLTIITLGMVVIGSVTSGTIVNAGPGGSTTVAHGGLLNHIGSSTSYETFGERRDLWVASAHVTFDHPLLGYGPDQFRLATQGHYSASLIHDSIITAEQFITYSDAHDFVFELAVTVGLVGLALFLGWLFFSFRRRSGPLVVCALFLLVTELAEPLHPVITPLLFIALGAATTKLAEPLGTQSEDFAVPTKPLSQWWHRSSAGRHLVGIGSWILGVLAIIPAVLLVIGDASLVSGEASSSLNPTAVADASTAETLLSVWAPPAELLAVIDQVPERHKLASAVHWARVALRRDPANTNVMTELSGLEFLIGDFQAGRHWALMAVTAQPWNVIGLDLLGAADQVEGRTSEARRLYRESLSVYSNQPLIDEYLSDSCSPALPGSDPSYPLTLGCRPT